MKATAVLLLVLLACLPACAWRPDECWICKREIHDQVRATLTLADGKEIQACCPRCALHYEQESGRRARSLRLSDYASGEPLPFDRAYLVEGSDETPCTRHHHPVVDETRTPMQVCYDRCMPSLIAFRDPGAARTFMEEHSGTLHAPGTYPGLGAAAP